MFSRAPITVHRPVCSQRLNQSGKSDYDYWHILGYLPTCANQRNRVREVMFCSPILWDKILRIAGAKIRTNVLGLAISQRIHNKNQVFQTYLKPLKCGDRVISVYLGQYHGCWCPGSLRRQDISSHGIDYVEYLGPGLTWGRISSTCVISMWRNDIKCKYMFMFPQKKLARRGLRCTDWLTSSCGCRRHLRQLCASPPATTIMLTRL